MASPLSPVHIATLNSIPSQSPVSSLAFDSGSYEVVHASSTTTKHLLSDESFAAIKASALTATATAPLPLDTSSTAMDAAASSSPFVSSVANATPRADDPTDHSSQENMSPPPSSKPFPLPIVAASSSAAATGTAPPVLTGRAVRPGSRILSGSELSPLKILQGRVTGGPPSSTATSTTLGSPASPDSGAEGRRDGPGDDQASSTASSPPPTFPPPRRMSTSSNQMLPPALPLGRTPRKLTGSEKRFPVKISVAPVAVAPASGATTPLAAPVRSPSRPPSQQGHYLQQPPRSPSQQGQALFASIQKQPLHGRQFSLDEAIQLNEGLKQAIEIFEDEASVIENDADTSTGKANSSNGVREDDLAAADDTMMSTFSSFSAVPHGATLSRFGGSTNGSNSPSKTAPSAAYAAASNRTPRANGPSSTADGPLPNRTGHYEHGSATSTTNLLMEFTEQLRIAQSQQFSPTKIQFGSMAGSSATSSDLGAGAATPQRKNQVNLLDFEIPPLPTPRSVPTVTPRELESLKSNFLSEISSLKASLSGKEAEVLALKTAVGDAEKRVGECMEQLREERGSRDLLSEERNQWERRGREMEEVLRNVKGEIVLSRREREELDAKLDESEKRREMAEMMAQEAESKMAALRAGRATAEAENKTRSPGGSTSSANGGGASAVQREVEIAVERVARELHMAYKAKHDTKVAALKKSYESRWEKRVHELEAVAESLASENEKLRIGRDATLSRLVPGEEERRAEEERRLREARDAAQIKELGAEVNKLEAVVRTVKADNAELRTLLEQERVEKGELVMLAEEMMAMQQQSFIASSAPRQPAAAAPVAASSGIPSASPRKPKTPATSRTSISGISGISGPPGSAAANRSSMMVANNTATTPGRARPISMHGTGRMSGLKPPSSSTMATGGVPSRIGRIGHDRKMSGSGGSLPRPPSGLGTRSGLMSSIEKMGNYRGRE